MGYFRKPSNGPLQGQQRETCLFTHYSRYCAQHLIWFESVSGSICIRILSLFLFDRHFTSVPCLVSWLCGGCSSGLSWTLRLYVDQGTSPWSNRTTLHLGGGLLLAIKFPLCPLCPGNHSDPNHSPIVGTYKWTMKQNVNTQQEVWRRRFFGGATRGATRFPISFLILKRFRWGWRKVHLFQHSLHWVLK